MRQLLLLRPDSAYLILYLFPLLLWIICLLIGEIWQIDLFLILSTCILGLICIYISFWRLYVGILMYKRLPKTIKKPINQQFIFVLSCLVSFPVIIASLALLFYFYFPSFFLPYLVFIGITLAPISFFQSYYLAKIISIVYNNDLLLRELWPISFMTIMYYPMTARKVHEVIIRLLLK